MNKLQLLLSCYSVDEQMKIQERVEAVSKLPNNESYAKLAKLILAEIINQKKSDQDRSNDLISMNEIQLLLSCYSIEEQMKIQERVEDVSKLPDTTITSLPTSESYAELAELIQAEIINQSKALNQEVPNPRKM